MIKGNSPPEAGASEVRGNRQRVLAGAAAVLGTVLATTGVAQAQTAMAAAAAPADSTA